MVHEFTVSSRDVTNQTPPGQEYFSYDVIIPAQGEFSSDIPAGDGKLANLFLRCMRSTSRVGIGLSYRPARLHRLAGQYDNLVPTRFLVPITCFKIPAML
jgi:hypothetical protein